MANPEQQAQLNALLKWSVTNSANTTTDDDQPQPTNPTSGIDAKMIESLMGGPSDADLMRDSMAAICAPVDVVPLDNKMIAWDNFEQLIENLDNANNISALGLWPALVGQLTNEEPEMRKFAAWCISTAVQNNVKSQESGLAAGAIAPLAKLAQEDVDKTVRKKAISALSSEVRNFQAGMDELAKHIEGCKSVDATDMDAVTEIIEKLRADAASA